MIGNRSFSKILTAAFQPQNYIAAINMARAYPDFPRNLYHYLSARGSYPSTVSIRTPSGLIAPTLYSHHDLLTVNEVFCRRDYAAPRGIRTVVDVGSNIGISALYFLTLNRFSRSYLYEPNPKNIQRLRHNLQGFESRYDLSPCAVSDIAGTFEFGVEPTGRYGALGLRTGTTIEVKCLSINEVLETALKERNFIDVLKVDIEGAEVPTVAAIDPSLLARIGLICLEYRPDRLLHSEFFHQRQYGSVCRLIARTTKLRKT
jgi:FkbM family methyltransferase